MTEETEIGKNKKSAVKNSGFVLQMNTNNGTYRCKVGTPVVAHDPRAAGGGFVLQINTN
ncbi:MAG: hypothetical protein J6M05_06060 [Cardiobacteriaceae bacterium]|nr:hypothetical protein [Cardiobacteriaceae bacterium]